MGTPVRKARLHCQIEGRLFEGKMEKVHLLKTFCWWQWTNRDESRPNSSTLHKRAGDVSLPLSRSHHTCRTMLYSIQNRAYNVRQFWASTKTRKLAAVSRCTQTRFSLYAKPVSPPAVWKQADGPSASRHSRLREREHDVTRVTFSGSVRHFGGQSDLPVAEL